MCLNRYAAGLSGLVLWTLACVAAQAQDKPLPCSQDPIFSQQDFTVGHWDVYTDGKKTAEVRMEKRLADCVIHETWTPVDGKPGNGLGIFNYSRLLKSWQYLWASDTGGTTYFTGSLQKPGEMRFVTEAPQPDGRKRLRHWSLILQSDGTVRELSVGTNDGGKTWTTEYDLLWRKKG